MQGQLLISTGSRRKCRYDAGRNRDSSHLFWYYIHYVVDMVLIDTNFWGADTIQCTKPRSYQTKYLERERLIPDRFQAYLCVNQTTNLIYYVFKLDIDSQNKISKSALLHWAT